MAGNVRDILINLLGRETISPAARKAGDGLDRLGDKMDDAADDAQRLDREVEQAQAALRDLAAQFARTDDAAQRLDLTKAMRKQQAELRRLTRVKDLLPEPDPSGWVQQIGQKISTGLARVPMGAPGAAMGANLAAVIGPAVGATVAGAVLGGVGVGGVIGGVKLAASDAAVKAAGAELSATIMGDLESSATRFVRPTVQGIGIIRSAWSDVAGEVDGVFAATSRYVVPLARGAAGAVRELAPGLAAAARAAEPVIREISIGIPRLGRALGDALADISGEADEAAAGMRGVFIAGEQIIRVGGAIIATFADMFGYVIKVGQGVAWVQDTMLGWIPGLGDLTDSWVSTWDEMADAMEGGGESGGEAGEKIFGGLMKAAEGADTATEEIETFADSLRRLNSDVLGAEEANIRLEEAIDSATAAAKENGDGIDANVPKQRANRQALLDIATAANEAAARIFEQTGSQDLASQASERGRAAFLKTASAMGVEAGEARRLADQLFGIPRNVNSKVTADTGAALSNVRTYVSWLNSIPRTVRTRMITEQQTARGGVREFSRGGYVDGPGPRGVDSVPAVLAPGEGVLTADEVSAAGGPAGLERLRAALRGGGAPTAAGSGAAPAAGAGGGRSGGAMTVIHIGSLVLPDVRDPAAMVAALQQYARQNGPIRLPVTP